MLLNANVSVRAFANVSNGANGYFNLSGQRVCFNAWNVNEGFFLFHLYYFYIKSDNFGKYLEKLKFELIGCNKGSMAVHCMSGGQMF